MENVRDLEEGLGLLQNNHTNGARVLATNALHVLRVVVKHEENKQLDTEEFWRKCQTTGYKLSRCRPSMAAAITSALVKALRAIQVDWNQAVMRSSLS